MNLPGIVLRIAYAGKKCFECRFRNESGGNLKVLMPSSIPRTATSPAMPKSLFFQLVLEPISTPDIMNAKRRLPVSSRWAAIRRPRRYVCIGRGSVLAALNDGS